MSRVGVDPRAPIREVLPAEPTNGGEPALPSPAARLRKVNSLTPLLYQAGVDIEVEDDGRVSVRLPQAMLEVFLLDLGQRLEAWQAAMRRARVQESERAAQALAASGVAQRQLQESEEQWAIEYDRLRKLGKTHREALWAINGPKGEGPGVTFLEGAIPRGRARLHRRGELPARPYGTRAERAARSEEILRLAQEKGVSVRKIADRLNISYAVVHNTLKQADAPMPDRRRRSEAEAARLSN